MSDRLLTEAEAFAPIDLGLLHRASWGVVAELLDAGGDESRYRETVRALALVPAEVRWWLDLTVAAEMFANDEALVEPVGFRCP
jgi:hypothetical protein